MLADAINWTEVLVLGIPAYIAALGGALAAVIAAVNRRSLRLPSGGRIGEASERTHHLAEVSAIRTARIDRATNGDTVAGPGDGSE